MSAIEGHLKIGLVTGEFPPMKGGVGAFTRELAMALHEQEHQVHIITSRKASSEPTRRSLWQPHEPIQLSYAVLHPRVNRWWWSAVSLIAELAIEAELDVVNLQYQASAYHMKLPAINLLPWRLRGVVPVIVTFHDLRVPYLFPKAGRLRPWVVNQLAKNSDGVIVTNYEDLQRLRKTGLDSGQIKEIPIGSNVRALPTTKEEVSGIRNNLALSDGDILLGYFGFINRTKGPDLLIDALELLDASYHVVFMGASTGSSDSINNETYLNKIKNQIVEADLDSRVHWTGFLSDEELSTFMQACDLMVMPYRDGVSYRRGTLMAILANGRPLITTIPKNPIPKLEHGKNVWLTPVDDVDKLRQAILVLSADEEKQKLMAEEAQLLAQHFNWDKIAFQTTEFMQKIIGRPK
jgi:glycosyltransferase involved in cell wall biosynthesis